MIDFYNRFMGGVDKADQMLEPYSYDKKSLAWFKKLGMHFIDRMCLNSYILYKSQNPSYTKDFMGYIRDVAEALIQDYSRAGKEIIKAYYDSRPAPPRRRRPARQAAAAPQAAVAPQADVAPQAAVAPQPRQRRVPAAPRPDAATQLRQRRAAQRAAAAAAQQAAPQPAQQAAPQPDAQADAPVNRYVPLYHQLMHIPPTEKKKNPTRRCRQCYFTFGERHEVRWCCVGCIGLPALHQGSCFDEFHQREFSPPVARRTREARRVVASPPIPRRTSSRVAADQPQPASVAGPSGHQGAPSSRSEAPEAVPGPSGLQDASASRSEAPEAVVQATTPSRRGATSRRKKIFAQSRDRKRPRRDTAKKAPDGQYILPSTDSESDPDDL